eukprot:3632404-Rhodomonas_salina.1
MDPQSSPEGEGSNCTSGSAGRQVVSCLCTSHVGECAFATIYYKNSFGLDEDRDLAKLFLPSRSFYPCFTAGFFTSHPTEDLGQSTLSVAPTQEAGGRPIEFAARSDRSLPASGNLTAAVTCFVWFGSWGQQTSYIPAPRILALNTGLILYNLS